jgi:hypothetical protein
MFAIANKYALAEEVTLDTREQKKERSQATRTSPAPPRAMTRRGKRIIPSTQWNGCDATRSTGKDQVNLKASCITFVFSTPRESTKPRTVTNSKVSQMRCSRLPSGPIKRKNLKSPRATSSKLIMVNYIYGGLDSCVEEEVKTHSPGGHSGLTRHP